MRFKLCNLKWSKQCGEYGYHAKLESTQDGFVLNLYTNSLLFDNKNTIFMDAELYKDGNKIASWDTWGTKREVTGWVKHLVKVSEDYLSCTFAFQGYFMMKDLQ